MILGIDTSNYTTSVAVVSEGQQLLFDQRQVLEVAEGERGLQQSAAVFQHLQNMPGLLEAALAEYRSELRAICYSASPRPLEGSYMPVFRVGEGFAQTLAAALDVPLLTTTHQEGHLAAGIWSSGFRPTGPFLVTHLSGGTTDLLRVEPLAEGGYAIETLGSSSDLHAGQFVDRIGVKLGLTFPAGMQLEQMALGVVPGGARGRRSGEIPGGSSATESAELRSKVVMPSAVSGYTISFSGPCSAAERAVDGGVEPSDVAFAVFRCIANSVEKVLKPAMTETGLKEVLFVGGVASNSLIKERLQRLTHLAVGASLHFAAPRYSRDNAVGVALIGLAG